MVAKPNCFACSLNDRSADCIADGAEAHGLAMRTIAEVEAFRTVSSLVSECETACRDGECLERCGWFLRGRFACEDGHDVTLDRDSDGQVQSVGG